MPSRWPSTLSHLAVATLVFALSAPGLGYRSLWQDEVDTADRARTVCESGVPRVIDRSGVASLNVGGQEIEDGDLHRYQPWLMFYLAAAGLCTADELGLERDAAVRLPSVVLHAATSGLASWALATSAGAPLALANATGVALGAQSVRVVHDRTARYHALLDFLTVAGVTALGALRRGRRRGWIVLAAVMLALPHVHSISGTALGASLGVSAALLLGREVDWRSREFRRRLLAWVVAPGAFALGTVLALSRPWAQSWGNELEWPGVAGLRDFNGILYAFLFWLACGIWSWRRGARRLGGILLVSWTATLAAVMLADIHSFTRPRYFLPLAPMSLLWPVAFGLDGLPVASRRRALVAVLLMTSAPELGLGRLTIAHETPFYPFQGVRLVRDDARKHVSGVRQPLHEAVAWLRDHAAPDDAILFDYAPQYANWYLPGRPIALMPDRTFRRGLNVDHPIWSRPLAMPRWHAWYPEVGSGIWECRDHCDYGAEAYDPTTHRYTLRSTFLGERVAMCPVRTWRTHRWNNAPFKNLEPAAFRPEGDASQTLLLAAPCEPPSRGTDGGRAAAGAAGSRAAGGGRACSRRRSDPRSGSGPRRCGGIDS